MKYKILFIFSVVLFVFVVIEILGLSSYYIILGKPYSKADIKNQILQNAGKSINGSAFKTEAGEMLWGDQVEVLHPYLGFTQDPKRTIGISSAGFPSFQKNQYFKREPNKIIIALMGGSFANQIYFFTGKQLINLFAVCNKEIILLNFAMGGYKQPQQLMALNYLLMSGAEFDIVINVDGFNEITLPLVDNIKYGVSPVYPRMWLNRVKSLYNPSEIRLIGKIEYLKELKKLAADFVKRNKLYRSPTLSLIWKIADNQLDMKISSSNLEMRQFLNHATSFAVTGPEYTFLNDEKLYSELADLWGKSSVLMHDICTANGIEYYHFLQPNQYVPNSKKLSPYEIKYAYTPNHLYKESVLKGYPFLRERGNKLKERGILFFDLTDIFIEYTDTFYNDTCCHLNKNGYEIIVEKIVEYIRAETKLSRK